MRQDLEKPRLLARLCLGLGSGEAIRAYGCLATTAIDAKEVLQFRRGGSVRACLGIEMFFGGKGQAREVSSFGSHGEMLQLANSMGPQNPCEGVRIFSGRYEVLLGRTRDRRSDVLGYCRLRQTDEGETDWDGYLVRSAMSGWLSLEAVC